MKDRINNIFEQVSQNGRKYMFPNTFMLNDVIVSEFKFGRNMSNKTIQYKTYRVGLDNIDGKETITWYIGDESVLDMIERVLPEIDDRSELVSEDWSEKL
jgi:hypothetical protein